MFPICSTQAPWCFFKADAMFHAKGLASSLRTSVVASVLEPAHGLLSVLAAPPQWTRVKPAATRANQLTSLCVASISLLRGVGPSIQARRVSGPTGLDRAFIILGR
jgi:hypothetical protein